MVIVEVRRRGLKVKASGIGREHRSKRQPADPPQASFGYLFPSDPDNKSSTSSTASKVPLACSGLQLDLKSTKWKEASKLIEMRSHMEQPDIEAEIERFLAALPLNIKNANAEKIVAWKKPALNLRRLLKKDYVRSLRRALGYAEVKVLLEAFEEIFPKINSSSVAMTSDEGFQRVADKSGVYLKAAPYVDDDGMALRGFYVSKGPAGLKRPLVFLNTAHHRVAVGTTFVHELGHHVAAEKLNLRVEPLHFFYDAGYADHLSDPSELAADIMVCFAAYPARVARRIFATPWNWGLVARAENLSEAAFAEVQKHIWKTYKFDLPLAQLNEEQRLHYLGGMVHYAKLRWALLAEYDL